MKKAKFTKNGKEIIVTALTPAGMGFISNLVCSGWYTEEESFDLCYQNDCVSIEEVK